MIITILYRIERGRFNTIMSVVWCAQDGRKLKLFYWYFGCQETACESDFPLRTERVLTVVSGSKKKKEKSVDGTIKFVMSLSPLVGRKSVLQNRKTILVYCSVKV